MSHLHLQTQKNGAGVRISNVVYETVSLFVPQYKLHKKSVLARFDRSLFGYLLFYSSLVQSLSPAYSSPSMLSVDFPRYIKT